MEMNADSSKVKYELLLASRVGNHSAISSQTATRATSQCSLDLYAYLHLDAHSGLITLNKSLDREECSRYKYYVRGTDLLEPRITSLVVLSIRVLDENDNVPRFEQDSYTYYIAENTLANTSHVIRVIDADAAHSDPTDLIFEVENVLENDSNENLMRHFAVVKDLTRSVKLVIKRPLDFETQNKFAFKLSLRETDTLTVRSDFYRDLLAIYLKNEKLELFWEFKTTVEKFQILFWSLAFSWCS